MMKSSQRTCPVCGESRCEILHHQEFVLPEGYPLSPAYDVVACERCGQVYADTAVSQKEYEAYYEKCSKYEDNKTSTGGGESPWDAQRLRDMAGCIAETLPRTARMLDIGCANGGLLGYLKELGFDHVAGIDPSPACVSNTRALGIAAEVGSLSSVPDALGKFDGVVLSHVLEHVHDLHAALQRILAALAPKGCIYIEVPDAARYVDFLVAPFQEFNTEHINHFSLHCLENLLGKQGLVPVRQGAKVFPAPFPYPAIFGFYRRAEEGNQVAKFSKDFEIRGRIRTYIENSRRMMQSMDARLRGALAETPEVIVWGTGQLTMKLLGETALGQARIAAFVDGNPINQGRRLHGVPILAPDKIRGLAQPIVIASTIHQQEIARTIRERMQLPNPLILLAE